MSSGDTFDYPHLGRRALYQWYWEMRYVPPFCQKTASMSFSPWMPLIRLDESLFDAKDSHLTQGRRVDQNKAQRRE